MAFFGHIGKTDVTNGDGRKLITIDPHASIMEAYHVRFLLYWISICNFASEFTNFSPSTFGRQSPICVEHLCRRNLTGFLDFMG